MENEKFDAIWSEFEEMNAVEKLKAMYISQLKGADLKDELEDEELDRAQFKKIKAALKSKICDVKNGKYDGVFVAALQDDLQTMLSLSKDGSLGGLSPKEYLKVMLNKTSGAMFFFDMELKTDGDILDVELDIDRNELSWQAFD